MKPAHLRRPPGRLFCCLLAVVVAATAALAVPPTTTLLQDVVYRADGTPAQGTLLISWPAFATADKRAVAAGAMSVSLGPGGALNLALIPNHGASPAGTYYKVLYKLDDGSTSTEYWSVPTASPTTIADVRTTISPLTAAAASSSRQYATVEYVDAQDASKQPMLGFTPENAANKGQPDGYAALDSGAKVPLAQLPPIGGSPAGVATELQYRNGAALAAVPGSAVDPATGRVEFADALLRGPYLDIRGIPGVDCSGATDSAPALNAFFGLLNNLNGKAVLAPDRCVLRIDDTVVVQESGSFKIGAFGVSGGAGQGPRLAWCGPQDGTMLRFLDTHSYEFSGWALNNNFDNCTAPHGFARVMVDVDKKVTGAIWNQSSGTFRHLTFSCGSSDAANQNCVALQFSTSQGSNVEDMTIGPKNAFYGPGSTTSTGILIGPSWNAKNYRIFENGIQNFGRNVWLRTGQASIRHNEFAFAQVTDFQADGCADGNDFSYNLTEGSRQALAVTGGCQQLNVEGNNFDAMHGYIDYTRPFVDLGANTNARFAFNHFDTFGPNNGTSIVDKPIAIGAGSTVLLENNRYPDTGDSLTPVYMAQVAGDYLEIARGRVVSGGQQSSDTRAGSFYARTSAGTMRRVGGVQLNTDVLDASLGQGSCSLDSLCLGDGEIVVSGVPSVSRGTCRFTGTVGSGVYTYRVVARDTAGNRALASPAIGCGPAAATLSASDYNLVTWAKSPGAASYDLVLVDPANTSHFGLVANLPAGQNTYTHNTPFTGAFDYVMPLRPDASRVSFHAPLQGVVGSQNLQSISVQTCTTPASVGGACNFGVTWPVAFPDANYVFACQFRGGNQFAHIGNSSNQTAAGVEYITLVADTANATQGTADCIAYYPSPSNASSPPTGAAPVWRGAWNSATSYSAFDAVLAGGSTYLALLPNQAMAPANYPATWQLLAQQGDTGPAGPQGPAGNGVPAAGAAGQALRKSSSADYATEWFTLGTAAALNVPASGDAAAGEVVKGNDSRLTLAAQYRTRTCELHVWGSGTNSVLQDTDDEPASCFNGLGVTYTVTAVKCWANAGSPTIMVAKTGGNNVLSGNLTCGTASFAAGTLTGTAADKQVADGGTLDINIVSAGGTATALRVAVVYTF